MPGTSLSGFRAFLLIWSGQLVSLIGSGLTGFALGVWVFLSTGSTTLFALIQLFATLPSIVVGPFAGALVDRWDRRYAMILSDSGAALCTLIIAVLLSAKMLEIWHIYVLVALSASFSAIQWPAYSAATSQLVPKEQYGRASGMVQLADAVAQIVAPVSAGVLMSVILIQGVILVDFATFLVALITLWIVRIPKMVHTTEGQAGKGSIVKESIYGWEYIRARKGLFALLLFFAVVNFATSTVTVLFTPLVLSFSTPAMLGLLTSIAGLGLLAGSLLMSVWGGPPRKMTAIYGAEIIVGIALIILGLTTHPIIVGLGAFLGMFAFPGVVACSQAIWLKKTAPDIQGRVFAFRRVISYSSLPLAYLVAGPLADYVFNPLLMEGGALAGSVGQLIGIGLGRGIGLINILLGLMVLIVTAIAFSYNRLRRVEVELPDCVTTAATESTA